MHDGHTTPCCRSLAYSSLPSERSRIRPRSAARKSNPVNSASGDQRISLKMRFSSDPAELVHHEELQIDGAAIAILVPHLRDLASDHRANPQLLVQLPRQCLFGGLSGLDLAPGNSHFRLIGWSGLRWQISTSIPEWSTCSPFDGRSAPATDRRIRAATTNRIGLGSADSWSPSLRIGSFTCLHFRR